MLILYSCINICKPDRLECLKNENLQSSFKDFKVKNNLFKLYQHYYLLKYRYTHLKMQEHYGLVPQDLHFAVQNEGTVELEMELNHNALSN